MKHGPSITEVMICWTPRHDALSSNHPKTYGRAGLFDWPDKNRESKIHPMSCGACDIVVRKATPEERSQFVMSVALGMIHRDGLDAAEVHRALWPLIEYRRGLPPDTPSPPGIDDYGSHAAAPRYSGVALRGCAAVFRRLNAKTNPLTQNRHCVSIQKLTTFFLVWDGPAAAYLRRVGGPPGGRPDPASRATRERGRERGGGRSLFAASGGSPGWSTRSSVSRYARAGKGTRGAAGNTACYTAQHSRSRLHSVEHKLLILSGFISLGSTAFRSVDAMLCVWSPPRETNAAQRSAAFVKAIHESENLTW